MNQKNEITYISEKSISFTTEFRIKIAMCKTLYDAVKLFKSVGSSPTIFGKSRLKSLYTRYKSQYRNKGAAAFTSEMRGRKKIHDKKTYENVDLEDKIRQNEERLNAQNAEIKILKKFIDFLPNTCKKVN